MFESSEGRQLSEVELEIISLVVSGLPDREIAMRLGIRKEVVKGHIASIFEKLGVSDRLELVLFATQHKRPPLA